MSEIKLTVPAILFDMDGTLIDSTAGVSGAWEEFARQYPGLDVQEILHTSHGVRTIDNFRKWCPSIPEEKLEAAVDEFELEIVRASKREADAGRSGIIMLPGVSDLLSEVRNGNWAISTSATKAYASAALETAGIEVPSVFVGAEDVMRGKPFPDPYLLAASKCGVDISKCLVVEDAPSGIASGKASGAKVLAVLTSHSKDKIDAAAPDFWVEDLSRVSVKWLEGGFEVVIKQS